MSNEDQDSTNGRRTEEKVLFAFDDYALPLRRGVKLVLHGFPNGTDDRPDRVIPRGAPGTADSNSVAYYGSVVRVRDELWLYYLGGSGAGEHKRQRLMLATSTDGHNWTKPDLGLVEFNGNTSNNICDLPVDGHIQAAVILHEPSDPDPLKRFKLSFETPLMDKRMAVAFSADGLTWIPYEGNPVLPYFFEQSGVTKFQGAYYLNGQGIAGVWAPGAGASRRLMTHISYDFQHWTQEPVVGFTRDALPPRPTIYGGTAGPQVHLGAALWNRGDVIIGIYGMWNGHPSNDRRLVTMDLGLLLSYDALHFHEPVPDFPIIAGRETKADDVHGYYPALMQGQGFENLGDETLFWYSPWPEADADAILLATWKRDRLGHLEAINGTTPAIVTSTPIGFGPSSALRLNAQLKSDHASLNVSLVAEDFTPLPGYSAADATLYPLSDLEYGIRWGSSDTIDIDGKARIRIEFGGIRPEDARLFATYVDTIGKRA